MTIILSFIVAFILFALARANVGIFAGYGASMKLDSSEDIQLVEEDVTITPSRGKFFFDGTYAGLDRVEYLCKFKLKNLTSKRINTQVGFPLNTWRMAHIVEPIENIHKTTMEFVSRYNFIVQEEGHIYTVRYLRKDKENRYEDLFIWDISFEPQEEKILQITYSMPISTGPDYDFFSGKKDGKDWYYWLESTNVEWFGYVTETGKSWKGKIAKAKFSIDTRGFEDYLKHRGAWEEFDREGKRIDEGAIWYPVVYRAIKPEGWQENDEGLLQWEFQDYDPQKPIEVEYHFFNIPQNAEDTQRLVKWISEENELDEEDFEDIEDIIKAFHGHQIANERIKVFLESQIWYPRSTKSEVPVEVFQVLEQCKNGITIE